jgi:hypothetical protein
LTGELILYLVGEKFLSNQLLTGQEVGGALVPEDAGTSLQVAVNRLLRGIRPKQGIFTAQNDMTTSLLGSLTAESPIVKPAMTLEEYPFRFGKIQGMVQIERSSSTISTCKLVSAISLIAKGLIS